ncbi:hypothetical protein CPAV1605_767 [seawater metagenome]|uniref:SET domain-containing protein n=1 Tax=seawater metagenome TaxID=1561972 RepID=A0A5E8CLV9_9ZZZZ
MEPKLPWQCHSQEFFNYPTVITKSSIHLAGDGRFSLQEIKNGSIIRTSPIITLNQYIIKKQKGCIKINSYSELEKLKEHLKQIDDIDIEKYLSWFFFGIDNSLFLYTESFHINHSMNNNVNPIIKYNELQEISTTDIDCNTEFFWNYNNFKFPNFYYKWCKDNNLTNVIDIINNINHMTIHE